MGLLSCAGVSEPEKTENAGEPRPASAPVSGAAEALKHGEGSGYSVTLPMFEGPLDLLLHLCQKHELDILEIPIGFVTE